ncbi:MAG: peptidoglycan hydrolase-like protein with peptidoglycan-binding domain [Paracoccaceae bacterium]|jgi:peptidoglycan hydrolase-like protein with peptidoglycan-binding domain
MASLKNGSKGSDVKKAQTLLNKIGAKPVLKIDGIFGDLTEKATIAFQKKCALKVDGKIGDFSLAALSFGGKLPEMPVADYNKNKETFSKMLVYNRQNTLSIVDIEKQVAKFAAIASREVPIANKASLDNYTHWEKIAEMVESIIDKQFEFEVLLTKNPKKAEQLAKECVDLNKQVLDIGKNKIKPNLNIAKASMAKFNKIWGSTEDFLKKERAAVAKRTEEY